MKAGIVIRTINRRLGLIAQLYIIGITLTVTNAFFEGSVFAASSATPNKLVVDTVKKNVPKNDESQRHELFWEMPGRLSIYDLQFGPAVAQQNKWKFLGNSRTFNAGLFGDRLTLVVRFSYRASTPDTLLKFVIKLPEARQYEETVRLTSHQGDLDYHFTIHKPEDFLGSGMIYLYYGFSIVDVLDFTIMPGS
ncbi:MAG: hypothetical protein M1511_18350 [Deltaproteobacteria bacterium]|nr:hypothetical protein [Deltaproteobacteria bacterium]